MTELTVSLKKTNQFGLHNWIKTNIFQFRESKTSFISLTKETLKRCYKKEKRSPVKLAVKILVNI